jgi:hypothetical protein
MCGTIVQNWMWEYTIYCVNYLLILIQFILVITVITVIMAYIVAIYASSVAGVWLATSWFRLLPVMSSFRFSLHDQNRAKAGQTQLNHR